jgi:hypothetical protein
MPSVKQRVLLAGSKPAGAKRARLRFSSAGLTASASASARGGLAQIKPLRRPGNAAFTQQSGEHQQQIQVQAAEIASLMSIMQSFYSSGMLFIHEPKRHSTSWDPAQKNAARQISFFENLFHIAR